MIFYAAEFFRRVRIAPGLRVNLSKSGASVSIGRRGAWYTIGPRGQRMWARLELAYFRLSIAGRARHGMFRRWASSP